jgi:uncharacterized protein
VPAAGYDVVVPIPSADDPELAVDLSGWDLAAIVAAGFGAGIVNAVAGGGTLLAFPVLTALGIPSLLANVTCTVATVPGHITSAGAQRANLAGQRHRMRVLLPVGLLGGVIGGVLLLATTEASFEAIVPFLILAASGLLAFQPRIRRALDARAARRVQPAGVGVRGAAAAGEDARERVHVGMVATAFTGALYGGYFGAGLGIVLLASLSLAFDDTLGRLNALKQVFALTVNTAAAVFFVVSGDVLWEAALAMSVGALGGGFVGGRQATRLHPEVLRWVVVTIGIAVGLVYLIT